MPQNPKGQRQMAVVGQGPRQQVKGLSERVTAQESALARVLMGINQRFQGVDGRLVSLEDKLGALIELLGEGQSVDELLMAKYKAKAEKEAADEKASLEEGVKDGYVLSVPKIEEKSLIVGVFMDKEGTVQHPGRAQLVMPGLSPKFKDQLLGKEAGFVIDLPNGSKFVVNEIYNVDDQKYAALQAEKQKAVMEKARAAAAADEKKDAEEPPAAEEQAPSVTELP
jgi:hypothetical protein